MRRIFRLTTCTFSAYASLPIGSAAGREEFLHTHGSVVCYVLGPPGDVATEGTWAWNLSPPCSTEQLSWVLRWDLTSPGHHPVRMKPHSPHPPLAPQSIRGGSGCCGGSLGTGQRGYPVQQRGEGGQNSRRVRAGGRDAVLHLNPNTFSLLSYGVITPRITA